MEKVYTADNAFTLISNSLNTTGQFIPMGFLQLYKTTNSFMFHFRDYEGNYIQFQLDCHDVSPKLVVNDNVGIPYLPSDITQQIYIAVRYANDNLTGRYDKNAVTDDQINENE